MRNIYNSKRSEIMNLDEKLSKLLSESSQINIKKKSPRNVTFAPSEKGSTANNSMSEKNKKETLLFEVERNYQEQDRLLSNIGRNLNNTNNNMYDLNNELKDQGYKLSMVSTTADSANNGIELADDKISSMEWKNICYSIILHILSFLLFIAILIVMVFKFYVRT
jgi:hypothetical protein